jgi:hypothetical protein
MRICWETGGVTFSSYLFRIPVHRCATARPAPERRALTIICHPGESEGTAFLPSSKSRGTRALTQPYIHVILSAAVTSRSEVMAESKDPYALHRNFGGRVLLTDEWSFKEFVSYLLIKSPKSLTNKDFTSNPFKLKDLEKFTLQVFDSKRSREGGLQRPALSRETLLKTAEARNYSPESFLTARTISGSLA